MGNQVKKSQLQPTARVVSFAGRPYALGPPRDAGGKEWWIGSRRRAGYVRGFRYSCVRADLPELLQRMVIFYAFPLSLDEFLRNGGS